MSTTSIVHLDEYRGRREQRVQRTLALLAPDPVRLRLAEHLERLLREVGGDRAAVVWTDDDDGSSIHPHVVLDMHSERPRHGFDERVLGRAWDRGIPGAVDAHDQPRSLVPDAPRSIAAVALGSDGLRTWFAVVDSVAGRDPLRGERWERLLYRTGECASLLLHRELLDEAEGPGRAEAFTGWSVLADLEEPNASRSRITQRFLVLRFLRSLLDDDLWTPATVLCDRVDALRAELAEAPADDESAMWDAVIGAAEARDAAGVAQAALELGLHAEELGELEGAVEALRSAYWVAALAGEAECAVDAARFLGRALRRAGRWDESERWFENALGVSEAIDSGRGAALSLEGWAFTLRARGNTPRARALLGRALDAAKGAEDPYALGSVHQHLMTLAHLSDDAESSVRHGWASIDAYDTPRDRLRVLVSMAGILMDLGSLDLAEQAYELAVERVSEPYFRAFAVEGYAHVAALRGRREDYERRYQAVLDMGWKTGGVDFQAQAYLYRGRAYEALGDRDEARSWFERALAFAEDASLNAYIFQAEDALARLDRAPARQPAPAAPLQPETVIEVRGGLGRLRSELAGAVSEG